MDLLDIEKELGGPDGQKVMETYDGVLVNLGTRLNHELEAGMPSEDYAAASQLKDAVVIARKLLRLAVKDSQDSKQ